MIAYVKGELAAIYEDRAVIDVSGIGYNVLMPASSLDTLPGIGNTVKVYTYLSVREDAMLLYGFITKDELDLYKLLITVNGVGPKAALMLLSAIGPDELKIAIVSSDSKLISKAPGIGPKTAQRIIIDLKDKIDLLESIENKLSSGEQNISNAGFNEAMTEASEALTALGYSKKDAYAAVKSVDSAHEMTVEDILKSALKNISRL